MVYLDRDVIEQWTHRKMKYGRFGIFVCGYIVFLCGGAMIFSLVEAPHENRHREELQQIRDSFIRNATCVTGDMHI